MKKYSLSGKIGKKALSANITLSPFTEDKVKSSKILEHLISGDAAKLAVKYPKLYATALQVSAAMDDKVRSKHKELGKLEKSFRKNKMRTKRELTELVRSAIKAGAKEVKGTTAVYVNDEKMGDYPDLVFKGSKGVFDSDNLKIITDDFNFNVSGKPTITKKDGMTVLTVTKKGKDKKAKKSSEKKSESLKLTEAVIKIDRKMPFLMKDYKSNPHFIAILMAIGSWQEYLKSDEAKKKEGAEKIAKKMKDNKKLFDILKRANAGEEIDGDELSKEAWKMGFYQSKYPVTYSFKDAKITGAPLYRRMTSKEKKYGKPIEDILEDAFVELQLEEKSKKKPKKNPPTRFVATSFIGLSSAGITGYAKHTLEKRYSKFVSYPALIASLAAGSYLMPKNRQAIIVGGLFGILAQEFLAWRMRSMKLSIGTGSSSMGRGSGTGGVLNIANPVVPQNGDVKSQKITILIKDNKIYKDGSEITLEQWNNLLDTEKNKLDGQIDLTFDPATTSSTFSLKVEEPLTRNKIRYFDRTKYTTLKGM